MLHRSGAEDSLFSGDTTCSTRNYVAGRAHSRRTTSGMYSVKVVDISGPLMAGS